MSRRWLLALVAISGCVNSLPDQDLRIRATPIVAKMPAEFLWKEYQADAREADRKYWGKAVEISGKPSSADSQDTGSPSKSYLLFAQSDKFGVRANLLDDDAAEILKEAA
jgi:tRNA_anti-like